MKSDALDAKQAAEELRMSVGNVRRLASKGDLIGHRSGKRWFFLKKDIEVYMLGKLKDGCPMAKAHGKECCRCWEVRS